VKKVLVVVLLIVAMFSAAVSAQVKPIKIGLTTVLTGDRSLEGEYAINAAKIIQQEINDAGGVLGRPIEIVVEDALGTDVGAVNAYRKLASDPEIVATIGTDNSNENIAISSTVLEFQIPTTAQGSNPRLRDICNNDNPWLFQLRACEDTLIAALVDYAVNEMGYKRFAIIHDTETNSAAQAQLFAEGLAKYGLEPVVVVPFTTGTKDFSAHIARVQQARPDAIFSGALHMEAAILVQQVRAMGVDLPFFGSNAFADPVTIRLAGESLNGVYSAAGWVPNTPNPIGAALSAKYKELYGEECAKAAAQIYDHVLIITEAIKRAGTADRAAVRDAMNTIYDFDGAITRYDLRTNGDAGRGGLLAQIVDEAPVIIQPIYSPKVFD